VTVIDSAGQRHRSLSIKARNNLPDHKSFPAREFAAKHNHWTSFSGSGKAVIEVTLVGGRVTNCVIRPTSLRITHASPVQGRVRTRPALPGVGELDEEPNWIEELMFAFANPLESDRPDLNGSNVINMAKQTLLLRWL